MNSSTVGLQLVLGATFLFTLSGALLFQGRVEALEKARKAEIKYQQETRIIFEKGIRNILFLLTFATLSLFLYFSFFRP